MVEWRFSQRSPSGSESKFMPENRNDMLDFIRGLSIIDMMMVHYSNFFTVPGINFGKVIRYSDFAIEGFTLIAGFVVGQHYFRRFKQDKKTVVKRLMERILEIIKVYYLLVLTVGIPLALLVGERFTRSDSFWTFVTKSLFFLNQVELLHILPTFIPLFLLALPLLYLLEKRQDAVVLAISIGLFAVGNVYPHPFPVGDEAIFPVILWQIYFVIGILLGKRYQSRSGSLYSENVLAHLLSAGFLFLVMSLIYFGHHLFPGWNDMRMEYGLSVRKFPLNYFGFLYHGSILYLIWCIAALTWRYIKETNACSLVLSFGRHSLSVFVVHAYFAVAASYLAPNFFMIPQFLIVMNFVVTAFILKFRESTKKIKTNYALEKYSV